MSVRRLAEEAVQPASFAFNRDNAAWAKQTIKKYPKGREASAVIPLLMRAQEQEGWVSRATIEYVADMLGMPYIRVLEVATFYTQFQIKPVGTRAHVQVCGTTPCMLRGAGDLMEVCRSKIHPEQLHTNADGTLSWEEVECQGACVNAPMVMIFKDTYEDLTPERLAEIIDEFEAGRGAGVPAGPQNGRTFSAPLSGQTTLTDESVFLKKSRTRESKAAKADAAPVAPTLAAKPKTDAIETSPAVKSPSKVKVSPKVEAAASVKARLKAIKHDLDADEERQTLEQCLVLIEREAEASKKAKAAQKMLDAKVLAHYAQLSEYELKALVVDDKWLATLQADVQTELDRVSQALTGRIRQLAERYATPLPALNAEVDALAAKVNAHLAKMGFAV